MRAEIEIVGAVEPRRGYGEASIRALLAAPTLALDHGGEFTGRPTTTIRATTQHVLKERDGTTIAPTRGELRHAVEGIRRREQSYGVHPPQKTWFLRQDDGGLRVGNVTPRLSPLHLAEAHDDPERLYRQLRAMFRMYVRVAAQFRVRLDEGLSNFASDTHGQLYYIDDDLHVWDDFAHFSQSIGVTLRKTTTLSPEFAQALGEDVRDGIVAGFGSSAPCRLITDALAGLYFNGTEQEQRRDGFVDGLLGPGHRGRSRRAEADPRPIALIADVHANYPALTAVLAEARERGIDHGLVLGDVVGYGPHPRECLAALRETGFDIVRGNHDQAAATGVQPPGFSDAAFEVIEWTREQVDAADLAWLGQLPVRIERDGLVAQHGAPMDPTYFNAYVYRLTYEDNLRYLSERGIRLGFHGHTHTPSVYYATAASSGLDEAARQSLSAHRHALVCPGSVGQPRRGGIEAQWALFDPSTFDIEFVSTAYDIERTLADMVSHDFPSVLIKRLRAGQ